MTSSLWPTRLASRVLKKIAAMEDDLVDDPDETGALSAALKDAVSPPVLRRLSLMSRTQQAGDTSFEHPARKGKEAKLHAQPLQG